MRYKIPCKEAGFYPSVLAILERINVDDLEPNSKYYHPADTFLLAFTDAVECLSRLADRITNEMELARSGNRKKSPEDTLVRMDNIRLDVFSMIFHCGNFIEACQTIIKTLIHDNTKSAGKAAKEFNAMTEPYRSHVSKIINEIKHKHRRVRVLSADWGENIILGYYIEGVVEKGLIGPDPLIHKRHGSIATGYSLNWELQNHLVNMYFTAMCLESALSKAIPHIKNLKAANEVASNKTLNENLSRHLSKISEIPALYLPNEFSGAQYSVLKKGDNYELSNSNDKKPLNKKTHPMNVSLSTRVGLFNLGVEMPYYLPEPVSNALINKFHKN